MKPAYKPGPPMTLGNMRSLGVRSLQVWCVDCHHHAPVNVDAYADEIDVQAFQPKMKCSACGSRKVTVRPDWTETKHRPTWAPDED